ncbi:MAG TPA: hypothetical protein VGF93_07750 [Solirubrobacteraceae bacterium]
MPPPAVPPPVLPVAAPPVVGALGVDVAGADGVAAVDGLEDELLDDELELVDVVEVVDVFVGVVLLDADAASVEVGTVNGGTSDVSAVVEPPPQAAMPTDSARPLIKAAAQLRVRWRLMVGGT